MLSLLKRKKELQSFGGKLSYSQCGEDMIISYIFQLRGISMPSYLDVGCNDPYYLNNTAFFYQKGCRGVNVDANPLLIEHFNKLRPNDVNLSVGVSTTEDTMNFYIMTDETLSTFSKKECDFLVSTGKTLKKTEKVFVTTIDNILNKYCNGTFPDFLSLDVEGLDFEILKSINFEKSFPKVICVEAAEYSPIGAGKKKTELIDYIIEKGYYEYSSTNLNSILVKNEFWFING
jgi:FkbM family methyltransferase